jgi:hypothetical protein
VAEHPEGFVTVRLTLFSPSAPDQRESAWRAAEARRAARDRAGRGDKAAADPVGGSVEAASDAAAAPECPTRGSDVVTGARDARDRDARDRGARTEASDAEAPREATRARFGVKRERDAWTAEELAALR